MRSSEIHALFEKLERLRVMMARETIARLRNAPRLADPRRLEHFGFRAYSQNDEDGIVAEIFARIGTTNRRFLEIGAGEGLENNTAYLLAGGWTGGWIEGGKKEGARIQSSFAEPLHNGALRLANAFVTRENVNDLVASLGLEGEIDFLSLDIDGNDYHVFEALTAVRPRAIALEYNAAFRPPMAFISPYNAERRWGGDYNYGASLVSLTELAGRRGYTLVGCNMTGVNAFFVREEFAGHFSGPHTAATFYNEPAYELTDAFRSGHRPVYSVGGLP
jgi:hypothetical protein